MDMLSQTADEILPIPKRVRVLLGGQVIADSRQMLLLRYAMGPPLYYFPRDDIIPGVLEESGRMAPEAGCGDARFYTVRSNGVERHDAAWSFTRLEPGMEALADHVAFDWNAMEAWFEEDQEVYVHPRDPRKRIDIVPSSARVRVLLDEEVVAESRRPLLLFETGLVTRYYLPRLDVRQELLLPSERLSYCPYKGEAHYFSLRHGERVIEDVIWYYRYPTQEAMAIAGMLCFYQERVALEVDGRQL